MANSMFDLTGKVAVVTGGSRGIGRAICEQMAAHGAKVVVSSRKLPACEAVVEGIKARGGADLGEKTLLDALVPMTDTIEERLAAGAASSEIVKAAAETARAAAEATRPMQARRGRASYTGERSIGSLDPGAVAVAVLAEQVALGW